ncbi:MAG: M67 family metallopeptidase [Candidatus Tectomicrobia bacterium]|uniref:M67 family metallopeptidase n=1 Tax=Tectimicrobiota bacterium TaxID=2528274 RepID=A0A932CNU9_UNCTE|nr:M67 family metallopeptidase [Candidatus Tectomicrobia bacterium]
MGTEEGHRSLESTPLTIRWEELWEIARHGQEVYPAECCGILVGSKGKGKEVIRIYRARNLCQDRPRDRYEIDPLEYWRVDQEIRAQGPSGLEIIGFYHSHPDHLPEPSAWDLEYAWPAHSYLILSLNAGEVDQFRSWQLDEREGRFQEEPLRISGRSAIPESPTPSFPFPGRSAVRW